MNNLVRYWNQNRRKIITIIAVIVFLIIIIQVLNQMAIAQRESENANRDTNTYDENLPTQSIVGGDTVSEEQTKSNVEVIEEFIAYCNAGNIASAYGMLTEECKETLFPTQEDFQNGYYNTIFTSERIADIENFLSEEKQYTYRVTLYHNMLATGRTEEDYYQDYITVDQSSENGKLNINSFIKKNEVNKEAESNDIKITVVTQEIYKDYEIYEIKVENNRDTPILIDTRKSSKSIYAVGDNNVSYNSFIHEIASNLYEIPAHFSRIYRIKFNKIYSVDIKTRGIVFSDIVPDSEIYNNNPEEMQTRYRISVSI